MNMLKWLGPTSPHEVLTDDPLATISLPRLSVHRTTPREIYAVSRVNPIFVDESTTDTNGIREVVPPRKSAGSSGYESNPTDRTSEFSSSDARTSPPSLRSSLQSEAGSPPRTCTSAVRRSGTRRRAPLENLHTEHQTALSTIPEGQVPKEAVNFIPHCIPAPIWPGGGGCTSLESGGGKTQLSRVSSRTPALAHEEQRSLPQPPPGPPDITNLVDRMSSSAPPPPQQCNADASSSHSSAYSEISLISGPCDVPNSVRNAMIYGTLCRIKCSNQGYERLLSLGRKLEARLSGDDSPKSSTSWESIAARSYHKTACYFPPSQRPDFTLDVPGAERLLRKVEAAKRLRCWCRLTISFLGLIFFLLSVMAVSMLYTRGRRLFGSL